MKLELGLWIELKIELKFPKSFEQTQARAQNLIKIRAGSSLSSNFGRAGSRFFLKSIWLIWGIWFMLGSVRTTYYELFGTIVGTIGH